MHDRGLAEATARQTHAIVRKALKDAVNEGKLSANPAERVDPPTTKDQEAATASRSSRPGPCCELPATTRAGGSPCSTGCGRARRSVYAGATSTSTTAVLFIHETLQTDEDGSLIFGSPKADASTRVLPLLPQIVVRLRLHHAATAWSPTTSSSRAPTAHPSDRATTGRRGATCSTAATVPPFAPIPQIALHAARNTAASLLEAAGVPERIIMQILGQSQVQVTRSYQHAEAETVRRHLRRGRATCSRSTSWCTVHLVDRPRQMSASTSGHTRSSLMTRILRLPS
jgi:integrase